MPITWKNVNSAQNYEGVQLLEQAGRNVQKGLSSLADLANETKANRVDRNTQAFQDALAQYCTRS